MKALLKMYTTTDAEVTELRLSGAKGEDKPRLAESLASLVLASPEGFKRYNAAVFASAS